MKKIVLATPLSPGRCPGGGGRWGAQQEVFGGGGSLSVQGRLVLVFVVPGLPKGVCAGVGRGRASVCGSAAIACTPTTRPSSPRPNLAGRVLSMDATPHTCAVAYEACSMQCRCPTGCSTRHSMPWPVACAPGVLRRAPPACATATAPNHCLHLLPDGTGGPLSHITQPAQASCAMRRSSAPAPAPRSAPRVPPPHPCLSGTDSKHYLGLSREGALRSVPVSVNKTAGDLARVHGLNERVAVEDFARAICVYKRVMELWGQQEGGAAAGGAAT